MECFHQEKKAEQTQTIPAKLLETFLQVYRSAAYEF